jgi:hypothetical protein
MPTNGSRQGMTAGSEMVGRGYVEDVIRIATPPPPARVATFAAVPIDAVSLEDFSLCAVLVAIRIRYQGEHAQRGEPWRFQNFRD